MVAVGVLLVSHGMGGSYGLGSERGESCDGHERGRHRSPAQTHLDS